ncbi:MAG: hypothetical protein AAFX06_08995 [Planctomycetota bacterium]
MIAEPKSPAAVFSPCRPWRMALLIGIAFSISLGSGTAFGQPPAPGQGIGLPAPTVPGQANAPAAPRAAAPNTAASNLGGVGPANAGGLASTTDLPNESGQTQRFYDLRPYTGYLTQQDHPEQAVVDWIIRETGTDVWFTAPFGFLNANRDQLRVYHTREMHEVVAGIVDRFVAGEKDPQVLSLKVMTVGNPNWRSRAHLLMQHVNVDSPGVQAWLLSKENAAVVLNLLRQRSDTRQVQAIDLITHNGQTQRLSSTRGRNYVRNVKPAATGWPPYEPETGEIQEGYRLEISPLLSVDGTAIDCAIKAEIDQVDKLKHVELALPLPNSQTHRTRIDVPQVVSWRLHERFRWPSAMVLLLSCGVIASPERPQAAMPLLNLEMITGTTAGRADALMFIEFRGRASENLTTTPLAPQIATGVSAPNRGRY